MLNHLRTYRLANVVLLCLSSNLSLILIGLNLFPTRHPLQSLHFSIRHPLQFPSLSTRLASSVSRGSQRAISTGRHHARALVSAQSRRHHAARTFPSS